MGGQSENIQIGRGTRQEQTKEVAGGTGRFPQPSHRPRPAYKRRAPRGTRNKPRKLPGEQDAFPSPPTCLCQHIIGAPLTGRGTCPGVHQGEDRAELGPSTPAFARLRPGRAPSLHCCIL
ncbi:hypothetical protein NDU88_005913 [Pleurodeles waltl]|uniref:Uncharacterized protein n=1 Tax=Pleurodeles waltl TaxID=8319 RepID=A0AAV7RL28_PLEWA|nr:hypothetical protein NDU88_005913 [Pleurodeles waltl]